MKKFFRTFLCMAVVLSVGLIFAGCKGNDTPKDVAVSVSCESSATAYGNLPVISASATADGAFVGGTIVWDAGQVVTVDKTSYSWTFTPYDTSKYNVAKGTKTLTINKATPTANLDRDVDIDKVLDNSTLTFLCNGKTVAGQTNWAEVVFDRTKAGQPVEVEFEFVPTDKNFNTVSGKANLTPKFKPASRSIPNTLYTGTQMADLSANLTTSFYYSTTRVYGTCSVQEISLVPGKNKISYTFTPDLSDRYLTIAESFEVVAFGRENNIYLIENAEQLCALSKDFRESSFKLAKDIDLSGVDLSKLEAATGTVPHLVLNSGNFSGTIDGNGHKIFGINAQTSKTRVALFDTVSSVNEIATGTHATAVIKNLSVEAVGEFVLCAYVKGNALTTFDNVVITGKVDNAKMTYAPFITFVEEQASVNFTNCTNNYSISCLGTTSAFVGSLRLSGLGGITFTNCTNNADIMGQVVGIFLAEGYHDEITTRLIGYDENEEPYEHVYNVNNGNITTLNYASIWGYGNYLYLTNRPNHDTDLDANFKNNGTVQVADTEIEATFGATGLESNNLATGTSYAKVFAVVSCYRTGDNLSTIIFEEMGKKQVSGTSVSFEDIVSASSYKRQYSETNSLLTYSTNADEETIILVNFSAIKGLSSAPQNSDFRVNGNIELVLICYDSNDNIIAVSNNPVLAPAN